MLFRLEFEIRYLNGTTDNVTSRPAVDIAFEREFGITVTSMFTSIPQEMLDGEIDKVEAMRWFGEMKTEHQCFLAWKSSRSPAAFDDWIETVDEVQWKFSKEVDPTPPVQPATSSALSLPPSASPLGNSHSVSTRTL